MTGGYGLTPELADRIVGEDPKVPDYFESLVMMTNNLKYLDIITLANTGHRLTEYDIKPTPAECANFVLNELTSAANRYKLHITKIPVWFAAILLLGRKNGKTDNKGIKHVLNLHLEEVKNELQ